jgi:hypothetical protein
MWIQFANGTNGVQWHNIDFDRCKGAAYRGRDARYRAPPAQIPAGAIRAPGSHLGCLTAKRTLGQG